MAGSITRPTIVLTSRVATHVIMEMEFKDFSRTSPIQ